MKTKNPAKTALSAYLTARGYKQTDEADARDLITDLLINMRAEGKDIASELRMAAMNAGTTAPGLVTDDQKGGISAALEYAHNDQDTYLRVGSPTIDYGADWPDARERKATEYRAMAAAARLIEESHTAEQFDRLAERVEAITTDADEDCDGGCGRPSSECATADGAQYCADLDDFRLYGCPETFEQFEAKREAAE